MWLRPQMLGKTAGGGRGEAKWAAACGWWLGSTGHICLSRGRTDRGPSLLACMVLALQGPFLV